MHPKGKALTGRSELFAAWFFPFRAECPARDALATFDIAAYLSLDLIGIGFILYLAGTFFRFLRCFICSLFYGAARLLGGMFRCPSSVLSGLFGFMAGVLHVLLWRVLSRQE